MTMTTKIATYLAALAEHRANPGQEALDAVWAAWRALSDEEQAGVPLEDACRE